MLFEEVIRRDSVNRGLSGICRAAMLAVKTRLAERVFLCQNGGIIPQYTEEPDPMSTEFATLRAKTGLPMEDLADKLGFSARTLYRWNNGETYPKQVTVDRLRTLAVAEDGLNGFNTPNFSFIDLFAGIGGMRRGFGALGGECVYTSEWNKYAQETYLANYKCGHQIAGDITKISAANIPDHDVLVAGFPCQPFSIAGVSKKNALNKPHGFLCKTQGTLFFDVAKIIKHHQPRAFLLENVKNLVSHDKGQTFRVMMEVLKGELGYQVDCMVIDAKPWVPQHRERIFIAGFKEKNNFSFSNLPRRDEAKGPKLGDILHPDDGADLTHESNRRYLKENGQVLDKYTLSDKMWNYLQSYAEKHRQKGNGFGCSVVGKNDVARTLSARYYKDGSEILVRQRKGRNPRRLTPRECARLMGFDKLDGSEFIIPVSDAQAYRQFGNAVVVPVVEAVARHMAPWVMGTEEAVPYRQVDIWAHG